MSVSETQRYEVGTLVDGRGGALRDAVMVVRSGCVEHVGLRTELPAMPDAMTYRFPTMAVIPGLIDMHVHLAYSGVPDKRAFRADTTDLSYARLAMRAAAYAQTCLAAGFTGLRDCHAPGGAIIDLAAAIAEGHQGGPRIAACGMGLSSTGGHMDPSGWGDHVAFRDFTAPCDGADGYRKGVRQQIKRGAHFIKINACHSRPEGPKGRSDDRFRREMTDEELHAVMDEAHMHGRKVAAHAPGGSGVTAAVQAGVDSIEHGHWIDDATLDLMAANGTAYVPTLTVNERNFDFSREELRTTKENWDWLLWSRDVKWETLERARARGVRVLVGTDAGYMLPHGTSHAMELTLLVKGGYTPLEAITAATRDAAAWLGWQDIGTLESGNVADFVLVDGDPTERIEVLHDPAALRVFQGGKEAACGARHESALAANVQEPLV